MDESPKFSASDLQVQSEIGEGNYSHVQIAVSKANQSFALKKLYFWNDPQRIINEITILQKVKHRHIIELLGVFKDKDEYVLVFPYIPHEPFRTLIPMKYKTIALYLHGLLSGIAHLHSHNIIHRDIKPGNYLFDISTSKGYLIDFSFAEIYSGKPVKILEIENKEEQLKNDLLWPEAAQDRLPLYANHTGTRGFRAPEVLLASSYQTPKIDIWGVGVILLSCLTLRYPFFIANDDFSALIEYSQIFGSQKIGEAAAECNRKISFPLQYPPKNLKSLVISLNPYINELEIPQNVYDLLENLLEPVPSKRYTADQARTHPFFMDSGLFRQS